MKNKPVSKGSKMPRKRSLAERVDRIVKEKTEGCTAMGFYLAMALTEWEEMKEKDADHLSK